MTARHPEWIRARAPTGDTYADVRQLLADAHLNTVCAEAQCPNLGECWNERTVTVMILGDTCTRACRFCGVATGRPTWFDADEPHRVADALAGLGLRHVVVTSVARDDLADGGASAFAETIRAIRERVPGTGIEVLIPDFNGAAGPLRTVVDAGPDVLDHNIETVARLQRPIRRRARYDRSLEVLARAHAWAADGLARRPMLTKSSLMVGLGETRTELSATFRDLRSVECDILTIGQYLRPSPDQVPVERFYAPEEFEELRVEALALGFRWVESAPLVRTSYRAARAVGMA